MNTVLYEIQFKDGTSAAYGANILAENLWRNYNNEGYNEDSVHSILDIKFEKNAVKDGYVKRNGKDHL